MGGEFSSVVAIEEPSQDSLYYYLSVFVLVLDVKPLVPYLSECANSFTNTDFPVKNILDAFESKLVFLCIAAPEAPM